MPLGQRAGDKSDSRYCGVEVLDFPAGEGLPAVLNHSLAFSFDFILAPLVGTELLPLQPAAFFSSTPLLSLTCSAPRCRSTPTTGPRPAPRVPTASPVLTRS